MSKWLQNKVDQIPQRNKDITFGYVKECEQKNDQRIPQTLKYLFLFYFNPAKDAFDTKDSNSKIMINPNGDSIQIRNLPKISTGLRKMKVISYLENVVSNGIHIWKFTRKKNGFVGDMIGIRNIDISSLRLYGNFDEKSNPDKWSVSGYSLYLGGLRKGISTDGRHWTNSMSLFATDHYPWGFMPNDIIQMTVNFNTLSLHYKINDNDYGKVYDIKAGHYRAAVGLEMYCSILERQNNVELQLISYQHIV